MLLTFLMTSSAFGGLSVATWKRTQLELLESGTDVPDHLLQWNVFQQNFLLTWVDLNA